MIKIHTAKTPALDCAQFIASQLEDLLKTGETILFISGGSIGKLVASELVKSLSSMNLHGLHLSLVDERLGIPNHPQSNVKLLKNSGLIDHVQKQAGEVSLPDLNQADSVKAYGEIIKQILNKSQKRTIGVFGIGSDGHTAGIKPFKSVEEFNLAMGDKEYVIEYKAADFDRMTLTPYAISQIQTGIIYAAGEEKRLILHKFLGQETAIWQQPMQILNRIPKLHLFTELELTKIS